MTDGNGEQGQVLPWGLDSDMSPVDFLIGHLSGSFVGEQESLENASVALLSATFMQAGLTTDKAIDKAYDYLERGATLKWDGRSLSFDFKEAPLSGSDERG